MGRKSRADKATSSRQKIIEAASSLFIERGYHGASLQSIAKKAGVNKALLFYYFENKENLFDQALFVPQKVSIEKMIADASRIKNPEKRLKFIIDAYLEKFEKGLELLHATFSEIAPISNKSRDHIKKFIKLGISPIEDTIRCGIQKGIFRKVDPHIAAISLIGMLRVFGIQEVITGQSYKAKDIGKIAEETFIRGLLKSEKEPGK